MKKFLKTFGILWLIMGIAFFIYIYYAFSAKGFENSLLKSNSDVEVTSTDDLISFTPSSTSKGTIFFYPGALVDPFAYTPMCRQLSDNGYKTIIVRMPWRMATKGYNLIKELNLLVDNENCTLIGHSQGGKMAGQFVYENPEAIENLILLGTTHPRDIDISDFDINVLKIYGSNDGVASPQKVEKNKPKLPSNTVYYKVKGGNHSQFGYYGHQVGDNTAEITKKEQMDLTLLKILEFLESSETK